MFGVFKQKNSDIRQKMVQIEKGMTHFEIRKKFIHFFKNRGHKVQLSSSLIPNNDPSLLFVNAGMNQFKNVFLGLEPPPAENVVSIQKCLRAGGKHNDLQQVGETPWHHTFFEMMGNFSFGGYFKPSAINGAWAFLTEELGLSPDHLWVTVHKEDPESYAIWKQKIPENKIYLLSDKDNFWQMGDSGPCGYCSEIHYYSGEEKRPPTHQLIEIWNLVFMEFYDNKEGERKKLSRPSVDTGMGLERLSAILQNKKSNYHTDLFSKIILALEKASSFKKYDFEEKAQTPIQKAFRVVADHSRAVAFLIAEGVLPGGDTAEYVLRKILRRAFYYSQKLNPKKNLLKIGVREVVKIMSEIPPKPLPCKVEELGIYPQLKNDMGEIDQVIEEEAGQFFSTLKEGKKEFEKMLSFLPAKKIPKERVWDLYSTYGLPIDLTRLMAEEQGWAVPTEEEMAEYKKEVGQSLAKGLVGILWEDFKKEGLKIIAQKAGSSANQSFLRKQESRYPKTIGQKAGSPATEFTGYKKEKERGKILAVLSIKKPSARLSEGSPVPHLGTGHGPDWDSSCIPKGSKGHVVLDKTCFYPEGGGPVGDRGFFFEDASQFAEKKSTDPANFAKKSPGLFSSHESGNPEELIGDSIAQVLDCQKIGEIIIHEVQALKDLRLGQNCIAEVNKNFRKGIKASHTTTHLLHSALRKNLGESVRQAGSLIQPFRLRFDFTYKKALNKKQIHQVEELVRQSILSKEDLSVSHKKLEQAKEEGFLYLKGENYSENVRVVSIGTKSSKELCGGIHVQNTEEIEDFKIISERGVQAGVRRIIAWTSSLANAWEEFLIDENKSLRSYLKIPLPHFKKKESCWEGFIEKQNLFLNWMEDREKELKLLRKKIVCLGKEKPQPSPANLPDKKEEVKSTFHPLAKQVLELREHFKLNPPDIKEDLMEDKDFYKAFKKGPSVLNSIKAKEGEVKNFITLLEKIKSLKLTKEELEVRAKGCEVKGLKGQLLVLSLPVADRKLLADISDFLLSQIGPGLVVLLGEGEGKYPVIVNVQKAFSKNCSAGEILKNKIAPLCKGQGGGKSSFAGGSISDRSAFSQVEKLLLQNFC